MSRRVVFITGATGQLGRVLLPRLVERWPGAELVLLLRAGGRRSARERFESLCAERALSARVTFLEGALSLPQLGLEPDAWAELSVCVTHIVHLAGPTALHTPAHIAEAPLRQGAASVLSLAERARELGQLRRLDVVSCTLVAGPGALGFDELSPPSLCGQTNPLLRVRAQLEAWWREHAEGLHFTIHRLGWMAPARSPLLQTLAHVPRGLSGARLDVVPLEQAASALATLLDADESMGLTTHLAAGSKRALVAPRPLIPTLAALLSQRPALRFASFALLKRSYAGALFQDRDWSDWDKACPLLALFAQPSAEVSTALTDALLQRLGHEVLGFR